MDIDDDLNDLYRSEDYNELESMATPASDSPLRDVLLQRARENSPKQQDINARRDALLGAYKNLMSAQQYRRPPVSSLPEWVGGAAMLGASENPNMKAFSAGQLAQAKALLGMSDKEQEASQNQAKTALGMSAAELEMMQKDRDAELGYLKVAGDLDYRSAALALRAQLAALKSGGIPGGVTAPPEAFKELGVPKYDGPNPYDGLDTVGKRQVRMGYEKQISKEQDKSTELETPINRMKRFLQLNELTKDKMLGPSPYTDFLPNVSDEMKEMESISSEITPQMRTPGSGSASDFDAKMFQKATVGTGKSYETNKNIAEAYILSKQNEMQKADFLEAYLSANGHLRGAQQQWKKYLDDNPIFDPKKKDNDFVINSSRKAWQEYFGNPGTENKNKPKLIKKSEIEPEVWKNMSEEERALFKD